MIEVLMPRLSDSMEEGTILRWLKADASQVTAGDELVEIETDKATMVYECDNSGFLNHLAQEGDTLPVGAPIAQLLATPKEKPTGTPAPEAAPTSSVAAGGHDERESAAPFADVSTAVPASMPASDIESHPATIDGPIKASPLARRIARERGLDLASVVGSGPGGRIVRADVEPASLAGSATRASIEAAAIESASSPPVDRPASPSGPGAPAASGTRNLPETGKGKAEVVELTKLQQTVARRMAESKATAPHFYLSAELDMSRCVKVRARIKAQASESEVVPSLNDMVVKAVALALREFPRANASYRDGRLELYSRVNVGIAVAAQDALVVPTVFDADAKGLRQLAQESRKLMARVRDGTITPPELSGGTFTVSNLGMYGMRNIGPVINPPQAAILGVGAITEMPVVRDGGVTTTHLMGVTLACDHRILYGTDGAEFLGSVRAFLDEPLRLAL